MKSDLPACAPFLIGVTGSALPRPARLGLESGAWRMRRSGAGDAPAHRLAGLAGSTTAGSTTGGPGPGEAN